MQNHEAFLAAVEANPHSNFQTTAGVLAQVCGQLPDDATARTLLKLAQVAKPTNVMIVSQSQARHLAGLLRPALPFSTEGGVLHETPPAEARPEPEASNAPTTDAATS